MDIRSAIKLLAGDKVILKETNKTRKVVKVDIITLEDKKAVNVMLDDGIWYSHKDLE